MPYRDYEKAKESGRRWHRENRSRSLSNHQAWKAAHPKESYRINRRSRMKKYGLSLVDYERMVAEQGGACAMPDCQATPPVL